MPKASKWATKLILTSIITVQHLQFNTSTLTAQQFNNILQFNKFLVPNTSGFQCSMENDMNSYAADLVKQRGFATPAEHL